MMDSGVPSSIDRPWNARNVPRSRAATPLKDGKLDLLYICPALYSNMLFNNLQKLVQNRIGHDGQTMSNTQYQAKSHDPTTWAPPRLRSYVAKLALSLSPGLAVAGGVYALYRSKESVATAFREEIGLRWRNKRSAMIENGLRLTVQLSSLPPFIPFFIFFRGTQHRCVDWGLGIDI